MFAALREEAGTSEVELEGSSVGEVLERAVARFGSEFGRWLAESRVWRNGQPADLADPVVSTDELALLPPVAGGTSLAAATLAWRGAAWVAMALLLAANLVSREPTWFVPALVAVIGGWIVDANTRAATLFAPWPALVAATGASVSAYRWSSEGLGIAIGATIMLVLAVAIFVPGLRELELLTSTALMAVVSGVAAGSLVLVRLGESGQARVTVFLALAAAAGVGWWMAGRPPNMIDAPTASVLAVILTGAVAAFIVKPFLPLMLASAVSAAGFLAGRAFGSTMRAGRVLLAQSVPGSLVPLDAAMLGAGLFWAALAAIAR